MLVNGKNTTARSLIALAALTITASMLVIVGCNDHRFTPVASIDVYPDVIDYEIQRKDQLTEQILITNKAVSARLEIYEANFEDSVGNMLEDEKEIFFDQSVMMESLQETRRRDGQPIVYASFPGGLVTDVTCQDDTYCHCVAEEGGEGDCTFAVEDGSVPKEQLGKMFFCGTSPLDPDLRQNVCMANYKYFNNAGEGQKAMWGAGTEYTCTESADCAKLGPEYQCRADGKCGSDIRLGFSLEYGLEQLVAVDNGVVNVDKAATWKSVDGRELCLIDAQGNVTQGVTFYGLNRCDQIAIKQDMHVIDDGDNSTGFPLYPKRQANFRLMTSPDEVGQSKYVAFCDSGEQIAVGSIILSDPVPNSESCIGEGGAIKTDLLSVDPAQVKFDQIPVRVLYSPDAEYQSAAVLSDKSFTMRIVNSAILGGSNERNVSLTLPENRGGPPEPIIELPEGKENPEPLSIVHLDGRNSTSPFGNDRKPFKYFWEWAPNGRPAFAQDAVLIESTGTFDNPLSVMGKWTDEGYPKIYFPIAGEYHIRMKVKDSAGVESGPNSDCPTCAQWAYVKIKVKPSQKLHVELIWNRGDYVDLDLFLVRKRDDGTFAVPSAYQDRIRPDPPTMSNCESDADCYDGAFPCEGGICRNVCESDADCRSVNGGWTCSDFGQCEISSSKEINCDSDADCDGGYCNPRATTSGTKMICTRHNFGSVNDTCFFNNGSPRWGDLHTISTPCANDDICNGVNSSEFTCGSNDFCDYSCDNSNQCLSASDQYLCSDSGVCEANRTEDDPTLDIDDVDGWGPENISLKEPVTGTYRVIARLYADQNDMVSDASPVSPVNAFAQIYLNGELALAKGINHELIETSTYWKVADIEWERTEIYDDPDAEGEITTAGKGDVIPICAGWTLTPCNTSDECKEWLSDEYTCETRSWNKFCSVCVGSGTPDECDPTIPCNGDGECTNEGIRSNCAEITGNYCRCSGVNEFGNFDDDPYSNPFIRKTGSGIFDPSDGTEPRSIWCDAPEDLYNESNSCSSLY